MHGIENNDVCYVFYSNIKKRDITNVLSVLCNHM